MFQLEEIFFYYLNLLIYLFVFERYTRSHKHIQRDKERERESIYLLKAYGKYNEVQQSQEPGIQYVSPMLVYWTGWLRLTCFLPRAALVQNQHCK